MNLLPPLLFGISASLDALLVGISYGMRGIYIKFWQNLVISLITLAGTCFSIILGNRLVHVLPDFLWSILGSLVLIAFGLYYMGKYVSLKLQRTHALLCSDDTLCLGNSLCTKDSLRSDDVLHSDDVLRSTDFLHSDATSPSLTAICILGCGLSANNVGIGLSASVTGLTVWSALPVTLFFSMAFLFLGNRLGKSPLLQLVGDYADLLSGLLLVGLGVLELFF